MRCSAGVLEIKFCPALFRHDLVAGGKNKPQAGAVFESVRRKADNRVGRALKVNEQGRGGRGQPYNVGGEYTQETVRRDERTLTPRFDS